MVGISPKVRASEIQVDSLGQMPQVLTSLTKIDLASATEQMAIPFPHRAEIKSIKWRMRSTIGGTATATLGVGKQGDTDYFATALFAPGTGSPADAVTDLTLLQSVIARNDVVTVTVLGAGGTAGHGDIALVTQPLPST